MSIQNEMPGYNEMNQYLNQQGTGLTPAEMHGLISGMICGGNDDSSWLPLLHDLTNEGMAFGHELAQALRKMHSATSDARFCREPLRSFSSALFTITSAYAYSPWAW